MQVTPGRSRGGGSAVRWKWCLARLARAARSRGSTLELMCDLGHFSAAPTCRWQVLLGAFGSSVFRRAHNTLGLLCVKSSGHSFGSSFFRRVLQKKALAGVPLLSPYCVLLEGFDRRLVSCGRPRRSTLSFDKAVAGALQLNASALPAEFSLLCFFSCDWAQSSCRQRSRGSGSGCCRAFFPVPTAERIFAFSAK